MFYALMMCVQINVYTFTFYLDKNVTVFFIAKNTCIFLFCGQSKNCLL